jgi:hypothetical protein
MSGKRIQSAVLQALTNLFDPQLVKKEWSVRKGALLLAGCGVTKCISGKNAQIIDSETAEKHIFKGSRVVYRFNCV